MRNYTYEVLAYNLETLAGCITDQNNILKKSRETNSFGDNIHTVLSIHNNKESVADLINKGFTDLKSDFHSGELPLVRYRKYLRSVKDFFDTDIHKSDLPKNLKAEEMLTEIEKFL